MFAISLDSIFVSSAPDLQAEGAGRIGKRLCGLERRGTTRTARDAAPSGGIGLLFRQNGQDGNAVEVSRQYYDCANS